MTEPWSGMWRGLGLRVELRRLGAGGGATLRVGSPNGDAEWLRFDCFSDNPHWHIAPQAADEIRPLDERGDTVTEAFAILTSDAASLLARAGAAEKTLSTFAQAPPEPDTAATAVADTKVLLAAERAMRHRPAVLDELDPVVLRSRRSEKWHTYPPDILPAWVAEMDFPIAAPIQHELRRFVDAGDVGYPIALTDTGLAEVFCDRMDESFGWRPEPERVEILSEVVQGMYLALEAYSNPGDGIVVQTPIYPPFLGSIRDTGRRLVENRMQIVDGHFEFDLDALEASLIAESGRCRVLLFCNPHNPSGRVLRRAELERVATLAVEHDIVVVSDEIHGDLVFDGREHIPLATLGPEIAARTLTLTSASKAFNIPGLRTAIAHFGSAELQKRFNTVFPRHVRGGLGLFGLYASMAAWRWAQPWLEETRPYLAANRDFAETKLAERIPEISFITPEATFLAWLDCRALDLSGSPAAHFMRNGQVALSDGRLFGPSWEGFVRLNFATSRPILNDVIDRMAKALGR